MSVTIRPHFETEVHKQAFEAAMQLFALSKSFPKDERYSLTDQIRRSSRSVCANVAKAWRHRRYEAAFTSKLTQAEGEAGETQTWIAFAVRCEYLPRERGVELHNAYEAVLKLLVVMKKHPEKWCIRISN